MPKFSVIIPTLNEAGNIHAAISSLTHSYAEAEIIVTDGGSQDGTPGLAAELGSRVVHSGRGRGTQCNAGAAVCTGDILVFLHADVRLPDNAFDVLEKGFRDRDVEIGTFKMRFDFDHWILRFYARFTRIDSLFTNYGDQCIVVRRTFFESIGGFPDWPICEDVGFLRVARHRAKVRTFPATVVASARIFQRIGLIRYMLRCAFIMFKYLLGVAPERLYTQYYR